MKKAGWVIIVLFVMLLIFWSAAIAKDDKYCEDNWEKDGALCYPVCKAGYKGVGPVCWKRCPEGYKDDGATCRKDAHIIKRDSYGRGVGKPLPCREGMERDAGLCYKECRDGYKGVGPVCWKRCPDGYKTDGATCRKDAHILRKESYGRGVGKPLLGLGQEEKNCYEKKDDRDGDGYAGEGAIAIGARKWAYKVNCPKGYVNKGGDKVDTGDNAQLIHPRRDEVPFNGKDDNCNGKTDEPTFEYSTDPTRNDGFDVKVYINCSDTWNHRNNLYAQLTIRSLINTSTTIPFERQKVNVIDDGKHHVKISVNNLSPATVYSVSVQFFKERTGDKKVGVESDSKYPYYTTTWSDDPVERARSAILLRGFKEYNESNLGRVGYRGTDKIDGTKYGANKEEKWCSEFYVWVTQNNLKEIKGRTYVGRLLDYFQDHKSTYDRNRIRDRAKRGDYIAVASGGDEGDDKKDHSAMFLAYDESTKKIWTLEGNWGNEVVIQQRDTGGDKAKEIGKLGGIVSSMVK